MNVGSIEWYKAKTAELHSEIRAMRELTPRGRVLNLQDDLVEKISIELGKALRRSLWSGEDMRPKTYSGILIPMEAIPERITLIASMEMIKMHGEIKYIAAE